MYQSGAPTTSRKRSLTPPTCDVTTPADCYSAAKTAANNRRLCQFHIFPATKSHLASAAFTDWFERLDIIVV